MRRLFQQIARAELTAALLLTCASALAQESPRDDLRYHAGFRPGDFEALVSMKKRLEAGTRMDTGRPGGETPAPNDEENVN